jgi:hypothetical protein
MRIFLTHLFCSIKYFLYVRPQILLLLTCCFFIESIAAPLFGCHSKCTARKRILLAIYVYRHSPIYATVTFRKVWRKLNPLYIWSTMHVCRRKSGLNTNLNTLDPDGPQHYRPPPNPCDIC